MPIKNTRLRQLRKARTLTQVDLARIAEVSQQSIAAYEQGRAVPSRDVQARLAAILGTSTDTLWPAEEAKAS